MNTFPFKVFQWKSCQTVYLSNLCIHGMAAKKIIIWKKKGERGYFRKGMHSLYQCSDYLSFALVHKFIKIACRHKYFVVVVYYVIIEAIDHGLLNKFWTMVI